MDRPEDSNMRLFASILEEATSKSKGDNEMSKEDWKDILPKKSSIVIWLVLLAIYCFVK